MNGYQQSNGHNWREVTQGQLGINDFWDPNTGLSFFSKLGANFQVINAHEAVDQPLSAIMAILHKTFVYIFRFAMWLWLNTRSWCWEKLRV